MNQGLCFCLACVGLVCFVLAVGFINLHWPFRYRNVEPLLERVFASQITIERYHRIYFPHPGFVADGLTLRRNSPTHYPPIGTVAHLRVEGRWIDLLLLRRRVRLVAAEGLHVIIPPAGSAANKAAFRPGSSGDFTGPSTIVDRLEIENAKLDLLRTDGGRYSFPIRRLSIGNLRKGQTISYVVDMQNAEPKGRIQAHGCFGPLLANKLGATPVTGDFTFTEINLSSIQGLGGTLSTAGHFAGRLDNVKGSASYSTPNFSVAGGRRTLVEGLVSYSVNGLNGDISLHSIELRTGRSLIHAEGGIAGSPRVTSLDLSIEKGRVEDLLRPFMTDQSPLTGPVRLRGHADLAPADPGASFFDRLSLNGAFSIPAERLTNPANERDLTAFSQRARGMKTKQDPGEQPPVLSEMEATVLLRNGIAYMTPLMFHVPGAAVRLHGAFNLQSLKVDMAGALRMHSDLSHVATGVKAFLLKPLAPFFKKGDAGAVVPIEVKGTAPHPKIGQNVIH